MNDKLSWNNDFVVIKICVIWFIFFLTVICSYTRFSTENNTMCEQPKTLENWCSKLHPPASPCRWNQTQEQVCVMLQQHVRFHFPVLFCISALLADWKALNSWRVLIQNAAENKTLHEYDHFIFIIQKIYEVCYLLLFKECYDN